MLLTATILSYPRAQHFPQSAEKIRPKTGRGDSNFSTLRGMPPVEVVTSRRFGAPVYRLFSSSYAHVTTMSQAPRSSIARRAHRTMPEPPVFTRITAPGRHVQAPLKPRLNRVTTASNALVLSNQTPRRITS